MHTPYIYIADITNNAQYFKRLPDTGEHVATEVQREKSYHIRRDGETIAIVDGWDNVTRIVRQYYPEWKG